MSDTHLGTRQPTTRHDDAGRRSDLDRDLVSIVAVLAILVLTAAAFVVQAGLPL
ncbi:hypothetical protein GCM10023340_19380 [Nocardioides marinquilinus]|uniref:Uncharacterized protein n=1 Tax=Nocardioides marinquilinus TaxID=1210400 RepID=A0ABP9PIZ2_9ACTN